MYPISYGYEGKDNINKETSYIKSLNDIEYPYTKNKYYLKKYGKYVLIVFMCALLPTGLSNCEGSV